MKARWLLSVAVAGSVWLCGCFAPPPNPAAQAARRREQDRKVRKAERDADKAFRSPAVKPGKVDAFEYDLDADVDM